MVRQETAPIQETRKAYKIFMGKTFEKQPLGTMIRRQQQNIEDESNGKYL
jgi:hypothetical protein